MFESNFFLALSGVGGRPDRRWMAARISENDLALFQTCGTIVEAAPSPLFAIGRERGEGAASTKVPSHFPARPGSLNVCNSRHHSPLSIVACRDPACIFPLQHRLFTRLGKPRPPKETSRLCISCSSGGRSLLSRVVSVFQRCHDQDVPDLGDGLHGVCPLAPLKNKDIRAAIHGVNNNLIFIMARASGNTAFHNLSPLLNGDTHFGVIGSYVIPSSTIS